MKNFLCSELAWVQCVKGMELQWLWRGSKQSVQYANQMQRKYISKKKKMQRKCFDPALHTYLVGISACAEFCLCSARWQPH
jgi:hypothetical protein